MSMAAEIEPEEVLVNTWDVPSSVRVRRVRVSIIHLGRSTSSQHNMTEPVEVGPAAKLFIHHERSSATIG